MTWLLILIFTVDGQSARYSAGIMATEDTCLVAGAGSVLLLEAGTPGLTVHFTCLPDVVPPTS
jgi:hypothetical protein